MTPTELLDAARAVYRLTPREMVAFEVTIADWRRAAKTAKGLTPWPWPLLAQQATDMLTASDAAGALDWYHAAGALRMRALGRYGEEAMAQVRYWLLRAAQLGSLPQELLPPSAPARTGGRTIARATGSAPASDADGPHRS